MLTFPQASKHGHLQALPSRMEIELRPRSYWFTEKAGQDIVHFSDNNAAFITLNLGYIPFLSNAGLDKPIACFNKFSTGECDVTQNAYVVDYNWTRPENIIQAGIAPSTTDSSVVHYGLGTPHYDEAEKRSRLIKERYAIEGIAIEITGSVAGLQAGGVFSFVHPDLPEESGDYIVVSLSHRLQQQAALEHENDLGNLAYIQHAHLIPRTMPFRPELKPALVMPTVYTARIESNGTYALLDENGCFKARNLFDHRDDTEARHGEASLPLRTLTSHSGPHTALPVGSAFPYREGMEVLFGSVDGNPNQPVILGSLPNPANHSPVTSRNFADHIIRTKGQNELLMHDIKDDEFIELKQGRYDHPFNLLRLDANSTEHLFKFASTLGAMEVYAKLTMHTEAGDSITQTHGNDRIETVENSSTLTTQNKGIHYQAATDITHTANQNITHKADQNIEHRTGGAMRWRVQRNVIITIRQGDQIIKIEDGNFTAITQTGIHIKGNGGGALYIGQAGGGLSIEQNGTVNLLGKGVTINGKDSVKFKGTVNWDVGAGGSLSQAALAPLDASHVPYVTQDMKFDDEFILTTLSGKPAPNQKFEITLEGGKIIKGTSDAQGRTGLHKGLNHQFLNVKLLPKNA